MECIVSIYIFYFIPPYTLKLFIAIHLCTLYYNLNSLLIYRQEVPWEKVPHRFRDQLGLEIVDVPGDGFCFIAVLLKAPHEKGFTTSVDELIIAIQEEINGNTDHYMNFVEAKCTPLVIKA